MNMLKNAKKKDGAPGGGWNTPDEDPVLFHTIIENMHDAVLILDWDGNVLWANTSALHLVGMHSHQSYADTNVFRFLHPDHRQIVQNNMAAIKSGKDGFAAEYKIVTTTGRKRWVEGVGKKIAFRGKDADMLVLRDITDRKAIADALVRRQAELDSIFSAAPVGIGLISNRIILHVNDRVCAMTGYNRKALIGKSAQIFYPSKEEFDHVGTEKYHQILEQGTGAMETRWQKKDGTVINILLSSSAIDPDDLAVGVTFTALDISQRKKAEADLRLSEERFRSMIQNSSDLIIVMNADGDITYQTPSVERVLGYGAGALLGKKPFEFIHPDDIQHVKQSLNEVYLDANPRIPTQMRIRSADGIWVPMEALGKNLLDFPGINGVVLTARDITARVRAEKERSEMQRQLLHSQKLESLGLMAGGIAHDFNNLLMAITGNLDLALIGFSPAPTSQAFVQKARMAVQRASDLTNQMLAYAGKASFDLKSLDINRLAGEMTQLLKASIPKRIRVVPAIFAKLSPIMADPGQIQQVIMNLIVNASDAIGEKPGSIHITTGALDCDDTYLGTSRLKEKVPAGRYVFFDVRDTGCGMSEQIKERLFDPFFTTKVSGRGLGMAAVLGIVKGHHGAIIVDSKIGKGTCIRVLFPVFEAVPPSIGQVPDTVSPASVDDRSEKKEPGTILVVDDEEMLRDLCKAMVERLGFRVLTAEDGEAAVDLFRVHAREIACVILDVTMPKMGGLETFQALKCIQADIRVIITSGLGGQDIMSRFKGTGLAGVIRKPFLFQDLCKELTRVLTRPVG